MCQPIQLKTKSPSIRNSISRSLIALITLLLAAMAGAQSIRATLSESAAAPNDTSWVPTGRLVTPRYNHTATLLTNGQVLVAGGDRPGGPRLPSAELYGQAAFLGGPATGGWNNTNSLANPRSYHTATLLPNGKVLVAGGDGAGTNAEVYDPATGVWSPTGNLDKPRSNHTATLLPSGKVLVAGGPEADTNTELYDPATGSWSTTGSMGTARSQQTATLLPSGKVLVAGGRNRSDSAELYDPVTGSWSTTGFLATARFNHTATLLPSGKVLVAGGNSTFGRLSSAELYDPATGLWSSTGSLGTARFRHTATLLPNGKVLVAAGQGSNGFLSSAELYDPGLGFDPSWQPLLTRVSPPILQDRRVLMVSGSRFKGISEASGGNGAQNSSANYPLVQLLSLTNEQTIFLPLNAWSDTDFTSTSITLMTTSLSGFPIGYALVTVFTNGIPSQSQFVEAEPPRPRP